MQCGRIGVVDEVFSPVTGVTTVLGRKLEGVRVEAILPGLLFACGPCCMSSVFGEVIGGVLRSWV